jgi:hypothetical protein
MSTAAASSSSGATPAGSWLQQLTGSDATPVHTVTIQAKEPIAPLAAAEQSSTTGAAYWINKSLRVACNSVHSVEFKQGESYASYQARRETMQAEFKKLKPEALFYDENRLVATHPTRCCAFFMAFYYAYNHHGQVRGGTLDASRTRFPLPPHNIISGYSMIWGFGGKRKQTKRNSRVRLFALLTPQ